MHWQFPILALVHSFRTLTDTSTWYFEITIENIESRFQSCFRLKLEKLDCPIFEMLTWANRDHWDQRRLMNERLRCWPNEKKILGRFSSQITNIQFTYLSSQLELCKSIFTRLLLNQLSATKTSTKLQLTRNIRLKTSWPLPFLHSYP